MTAEEYKQTRVRLQLTQQALADVLGVHKITIAKRESGALKISVEALLALEHVEGILKRDKARKPH